MVAEEGDDVRAHHHVHQHFDAVLPPVDDVAEDIEGIGLPQPDLLEHLQVGLIAAVDIGHDVDHR